MSIFKLQNPVLNYDWGSHSTVDSLFGITNPDNKPIAEIWMGAHPKAPSSVNRDGINQSLIELFKDNPHLLGNQSIKKFGNALPFLLKILSADKPLSIQAHPNKQQAMEGFKRENSAGITLNAPNRNYRDSNHKPELVYALTPFKALNGFRPIKDILTLFNMPSLAELQPALKLLEQTTCLKEFYQTLISLSETQMKHLIEDAIKYADKTDNLVWKEVKHLHKLFPNDIGIFSPLLLNLITLSPGQAMFLKVGTLHAYLEGTSVEIMACSDNVLRGGLTSKHVDTRELLNTIEFTISDPSDLILQPTIASDGEEIFPVPVDDFILSVITQHQETRTLTNNSAEILFCLTGTLTLTSTTQHLELSRGQSCFVGADSNHYQINGSGTLMRAKSRT